MKKIILFCIFLCILLTTKANGQIVKSIYHKEGDKEIKLCDLIISKTSYTNCIVIEDCKYCNLYYNKLIIKTIDNALKICDISENNTLINCSYITGDSAEYLSNNKIKITSLMGDIKVCDLTENNIAINCTYR